MKTGKKLEIIDGRQRYESILKYCNNEFKIKAEGLEKYKELKGYYYKDLPYNMKEIIKDYKMQIIYFTVGNYISLSDEDLEYMKRDLFRRYNYGITALSRSDIARAKYCCDYITNELANKIQENVDEIYNKSVLIFLPPNKRDKFDEREKINQILIAIRKAIITPYIPIIGQKNICLSKQIDKYYEEYLQNCTIEEKKEKLHEFKRIINNLYLIKEKLEKHNCKLHDNVLFFESMYWMFSILYNFFPNVFYSFNIDKLCHYVKNENQDYFDFYAGASSNDVVKRYEYSKKYIEEELGVKLDVYLDKIKQNKETIKNKEKEIKDLNLIDTKNKLITAKETIEIREIIRLMEEGRFKIQPIYQRGEVKSQYKASKIIESIILGIKLPPIYVYVEEKNGLDYYTVLDRTAKNLLNFAIYGKTNNK